MRRWLMLAVVAPDALHSFALDVEVPLLHVAVHQVGTQRLAHRCRLQERERGARLLRRGLSVREGIDLAAVRI
jgi:hypothetical protein